MRKLINIVLATLFSTVVLGQSTPKGTFIGVEEMKSYSDSSNPSYKRYHLSVLTFKSDSVFLEQSPIAIYKTDTIFSASDGGFYSYTGKVVQYKGKICLDLKLKSCDYCPIQWMKFTPPRILKDDDTTQISTPDTVSGWEYVKVEYPDRNYKIMVLQLTRSNDRIIVDKNIYTRQKRK